MPPKRFQVIASILRVEGVVSNYYSHESFIVYYLFVSFIVKLFAFFVYNLQKHASLMFFSKLIFNSKYMKRKA